jgi:hypothetical protein
MDLTLLPQVAALVALIRSQGSSATTANELIKLIYDLGYNKGYTDGLEHVQALIENHMPIEHTN